MRYASLLFAAALLVSACETLPAATPPPPGGASLTGELDLGDWRNATESATRDAFQQNVSNRYGAGLLLADATADLRGRDFNCGAAPAQDAQGRGDPPAQVCRRTVTLNRCTHTWQVHLFEQNDDARVARTRGLYDRRCGNDGLLGGPG